MNTNLNPLNQTLLFSLGKCFMTPGVEALIERTKFPIVTLLHRHQSGDWGNLSEDDQRENTFALSRQLRIFSSYDITTSSDIKETVWVITEADRSSTTVLLPSEY